MVICTCYHDQMQGVYYSSEVMVGILDVWEIQGYKAHLGVAMGVVAPYKEDVDPLEVWDLKRKELGQKNYELGTY